MKQIVLVLLACFFSWQTLHAQIIKTGDQAVNLGLGFGGTMIIGNGLPSLNFAYETLPFEKLGIGYISAGGFGAYKHSRYDYPVYDNTYGPGVGEINYNYWVAAGRGAYHFDLYTLNPNDFFRYFDVYAGVIAGFRFANNNYEGTYDLTLENKVSFLNDVFAGCRYQFSDMMLVYSEVGYSVSILSFGVSVLY